MGGEIERERKRRSPFSLAVSLFLWRQEEEGVMEGVVKGGRELCREREEGWE